MPNKNLFILFSVIFVLAAFSALAKNLEIAVVQYSDQSFGPGNNGVLKTIDSAGSLGAKMVLLHEMAIYAKEWPSQITDILAGKAEKSGFYLATGIKVQSGENKPFKSLGVVFNPQGKLIYTHQKTIPGNDYQKKYLETGSIDDIKAFDTPYGRFAIAMSSENESFAFMHKAYSIGVDAVLAISNYGSNPKEEYIDNWEKCFERNAKTFGITILGCNSCMMLPGETNKYGDAYSMGNAFGFNPQGVRIYKTHRFPGTNKESSIYPSGIKIISLPVPFFNLNHIKIIKPGYITITYAYAGSTVYIDRQFKFASLPGILNNQAYLLYPCNMKNMAMDNLVSFKTDIPIKLYIAFPTSRLESNTVPKWVKDNSFLKTEDTLSIDLGETLTGFSLFEKSISNTDEPVYLGSNFAGKSGGIQYLTFIIPDYSKGK
ncbi:MAG: carbon-nitrogen hydrolase family protein [bacterium]